MRLREPETPDDLARYYDLRWRVLRRPWGQPRGSERDALEADSVHLVAGDPGQAPLGAARLHFNSPEEAQVRFMAVAGGYRGRGIGRLLLAELERRARARGARRMVADAREDATGFYARMGYRMGARAHTLYGVIGHWRMWKEL